MTLQTQKSVCFIIIFWRQMARCWCQHEISVLLTLTSSTGPVEIGWGQTKDICGPDASSVHLALSCRTEKCNKKWKVAPPSASTRTRKVMLASRVMTSCHDVHHDVHFRIMSAWQEGTRNKIKIVAYKLQMFLFYFDSSLFWKRWMSR